MTLQEGREWWEVRIKYPFVGDMQKRLDEFQKKLIAAGEEPIAVPRPKQSLSESIFGINLY